MQAGQSNPDLQSIQEKIVAKRFDDALVDLESVLDSDTENIEALYMTAVCRRYMGEFDQALAVITRLKSLAPEYGRAEQEEGHAYRDMGQADNALLAYARACRFNPALEASWRGQLKILTDKGMHQQAKAVKAQLDRLRSLSPILVGVTDLISQGRILKAEDICRQYLTKVPNDVEGMRLLAEIGVRFGVLDDAEFLLESALKFEPENVQVRIDYIQALRKRQKFQQALDQARHLLATSPINPQFLSLFAIECMQSGDYAAALENFDAVLEQVPNDPNTLTSKGHAYKTLGEFDSAVAAYQAALASEPKHGDAYYSLANLKVYNFSDAEVAAMHTLQDSATLAHNDQVYLCFALGKAYEDSKDYEASFKFYERGNQLKKTQSRYNAAEISAELDEQSSVCTRDLFERKSGSGCPAPDPIFVVGLPRAGSTLLEQILSSHSQIDGTLELPNILSLSQRLRRRGRQGGAGYPQVLHELTDEELAQFGEEYIRDTRIHRQAAPYFVDKMPNNFRHIGLIQLILPNARIIDARRHPMACCFSGFKQLFAEGQEFTYGLDEIGTFYRDYVKLMDHWDEVLPNRILRVQYEDVVADLDGQVRRILEYCDLPFEESCINFHQTDRSVRTPSSEQVRQPIYKSGLEQWRNFEPWLNPLKEALGPVLDRYPLN